MSNEQVKTECLYDLETIRSKCQAVIDEGKKGGEPKFTAEWFVLFEIVGYCNGASRRVNDLY
jgi:hypothetical protein